MLGATQRQWFLDKIRNSTRTWKVWGNEVSTMQLIISKAVIDAAAIPSLTIPADLFLSLDQWDGYPVERAQIFTALRTAGVRNFVTVTGDFHTFEAGYQRINYSTVFAPGTVPTDAVGVEFLVGSISASNLAEQPNPFGIDIATATQLLLAGNRHVQYFNSSTHGYSIIEATPTGLTCTMRAVSTILTSGGTVSTLKVFNVPKDQVLIQDVTSR
jgi:alkaline phosphatase D